MNSKIHAANRFTGTVFARVDAKGHTEEQVRPLSVRDLTEEAIERAQKMVRDAEAEADKIIERGRAKQVEVEGQGYQEGYRAGQREGQETIIQQLAPFLKQFQDLTRELASLRDKELHRLEPEIYSLAVAIAKKIVRAELATGEEVVGRIVRDAIEQAVDRSTIRLRIAQADAEFLETYKPELMTVDGVREIVIESDPSVSPGGCVVESATGEIDARLETQFERFESLKDGFDA